MFGDPWLRAVDFEPLFTPDVLQPELQLPFEKGVTWSMTVGPHAAWGAAAVRAALDFAPPSAETGCQTNWAWVNAAGPGLVVRSEDGAVVVDMDGDGNEQTGWNIIYLLLRMARSDGRVETGVRWASFLRGRYFHRHTAVSWGYNGDGCVRMNIGCDERLEAKQAQPLKRWAGEERPGGENHVIGASVLIFPGD